MDLRVDNHGGIAAVHAATAQVRGLAAVSPEDVPTSSQQKQQRSCTPQVNRGSLASLCTQLIFTQKHDELDVCTSSETIVEVVLLTDALL